MPKMRLKVGDVVQVMSGVDKGKQGRILRTLPEEGKVVVEGINRVFKHVRRSQRAQQGGRLSKEMPVDVSNVRLLDPKTNEPTRLGVRYLEDGTKELYAKKSGETIRKLSPPRKAYAR